MGFPNLDVNINNSDFGSIESGRLAYNNVFGLFIYISLHPTLYSAEKAYEQNLLNPVNPPIYKQSGQGNDRYYVTYSQQVYGGDSGYTSNELYTCAGFLKENVVIEFNRYSRDKDDPTLNDAVQFVGKQLEKLYLKQLQEQ